MKNLFDVLKPSAFSVFSRGDRRSNYDLLAHVYTYLSTRQYALKEELIDELSDYIRDHVFSDFSDEEGNDIADRSAKEKASYKYRQFKKSGWIEEDTTEGFSLSVSMNENAIILLDAFRKIIESEDRPLEYTGYFYAIHGLLLDFDYTKTKALLEQVFKNTKELFNSLQGLSSSIKHFIEELLTKEGLTPEDILQSLLYKYQDQVLMTVFNNLKGRDNPSRYTSGILEKLKQIRFDNLDRVVNAYAQSAYPSGFTNEQYVSIEESVIEQLDYAIARFETVDEIVSMIDKRNTKFHDTALAKIRFLMNSRRDVSGLLDQALKALRYADSAADFDGVIAIESSKNIDDKSLYSKSFNKEKPTAIKTRIPQADPEEIERVTKQLFEEDEYSRKNVNEYAMRLLEGKQSLEIESIPINSIHDLLMTMLIQLYAYYQDVNYEVVLREDAYSSFGYRLKGFTLQRKEDTR